MRVALLNPTFWPETRRGSERVARDLASGLIERGHGVELITSHRGRPRRTVEDGLEVVRVWRPPEGRLRRRLYEANVSHVPLSELVLRRDRPDVAHALHHTDALAAVRWSRASGRPAVWWCMGILTRQGLAGWRWRLPIMRRVLAGAAAVCTLSAAADESFRRWLGVETRVIPPGVDLDAFTPGGERAASPTVFCAADPNEPRKRVGDLLEAASLLRERRPGLTLELARPASPAVGARLEAAGARLVDVDNTVRMRDALRRARVAVLPSVEEAFGLVLLEAMACGTPVVGRDSGGVPELIDRPEVGRLFDGGPEELARALDEVLDMAGDPATAGACREQAARFSAEATCDRVLALYRELGVE